MADNRPSEKMSEMLFCRYALQTFGLQEATLYAPSSRQEFISGYDAAFVGAATCRELYLQFKRPGRARGKYQIKLVQHQHDRLRNYPPRAAFYVGHTFENVQELQQAHKRLKTAKDFLKYFVAVDATVIAPNARYVDYEKSGVTNQPGGVLFRCESDKKAKKHYLQHGKWYRGGQLLDLYKRGEIGYQIELADTHGGSNELISRSLYENEDTNDHEKETLDLFASDSYSRAQPKSLSVEKLTGAGGKQDFGTALRIYEC